MHTAVQHGVDKINSFQADSLLSEEIDLELNKSIMRFVNLKYGRNNIYRQGFEESQKRIDDLRNLVLSYEEMLYFKERRILKFGGNSAFSTNSSLLYVDKFLLPADYLYHISSYCNSFKSTDCKKDIKFELRRNEGERIILEIPLRDLKVFDESSTKPIGWLPVINFNNGATPSAGYDEIISDESVSIDNIGGAGTFSQPLWDAQSNSMLASLVQAYSSDSTMSMEAVASGLAYLQPATGCDYCPPTAGGTRFWWITPYSSGVFYHDYTSIIYDPGHALSEQVINSIIGQSSEGVDVYYENYGATHTAETFIMVIDANIFNYVLLQEDSSVVSQNLVDNGYSVDLNLSSIIENSNGSTDADEFTTIGRTQYSIDPKVSASNYLHFEGVFSSDSISVDNAVLQTEDGASTTVQGANATDLQIAEYNLIKAKRTSTSYPYSEFWMENIDLKREIHSSYPVPEILNNTYWDGVNLIGKVFGGISQPIKYIQHDDILALFKDPFNKPDMNSILGMFDNEYINVYTLVEGTKKSPMTETNMVDVLPYSVKLTYLKRPVKVSATTNDSCDLPQHTHEEIVAMTVSSILEGISDPRYETHRNELNKNE